MGLSNAIIVGGGIGGLAVATALARRGVAVTLLERATRFSEVGAGLQVSPNGMAVLRALGLETSLRQKEAVRGQAVELVDFRQGREVARLDLMRLRSDQPYQFLHRADLVDVLASAAKRAGVTLDLGVDVDKIIPGELPEVHLSDGSKRRAKLVVAADGIHSVARPVLNGADDARFSGQVAWRALVPNTVGHDDVAKVAMGPGRHLVSYPVRGGDFVNLVAVEERTVWAAEGWNHVDDPATLRTAFAGFGGQAAALLSEVEAVTLWGLHLHPVAARWEMGNVALIGDAAHPTLPFLAQGANMALEDAWVLADEVAKGGPDWGMRYQARRRDRVVRIVKTAEGNAWKYHLRPGPVRSLAHLGLRLGSKLVPGRMIGALDWLYGHDVTRG